MNLRTITRLDRDTVAGNAVAYGAPAQQAEAAANNLTSGSVSLFGVSGKMASGKDTVAPLLLSLCGAPDAVENSFAKSLKDELDAVITDIRNWKHYRCCTNPVLRDEEAQVLGAWLAHRHQLPTEQAVEYFTGEFATEVLVNRDLHSRSRTVPIRAALQHLGTDVRRAQDDLYWVKATVVPTVAQLARGQSVYFTDNRFKNEIEAVRALAGLAVRLDVSDETQRVRMFARDGLYPTEESRMHPSEVDLDDYRYFDVRVSNDGTLDATMSAIEYALRRLGRIS